MVVSFEKDLYQGMPSGMPKREQMTGFSRCQHGLSLQRLKPLVFSDVAASLKRCPDTNLLKLHHYPIAQAKTFSLHWWYLL
jgi:hypothetical protein